MPHPKVLAEVTARLCERFPDAPPSAVREQVDVLFQRYASSTVRDFVPILVEREMAARLRGRGAGRVPSQSR